MKAWLKGGLIGVLIAFIVTLYHALEEIIKGQYFISYLYIFYDYFGWFLLLAITYTLIGMAVGVIIQNKEIKAWRVTGKIVFFVILAGFVGTVIFDVMNNTIGQCCGLGGCNDCSMVAWFLALFHPFANRIYFMAPLLVISILIIIAHEIWSRGKQ